ncbi:interleukin-1 receptor-associated kinase 1 [Hoplias malabaricus]|uniref:interleukin-1 receptor-associated kinase 1 n=1 Tax=Hoplias malabaricus TaxID=27720 RepID=UPI0034632D81
MSDLRFNTEYLYNLPAAEMNEFTRVMDSLPVSDWLRFASQVISDQTELRLMEQNSRRTSTLMHIWGCRNGTVGELLDLLQELELFRARDIILKSTRIPQPSTYSSSLPPPSLSCLSTPPSSLFTPSKNVTRKLPSKESRLLPKPGPPPPDLESAHLGPESTQSAREEHSCKCLAPCPSVFTGVLFWLFEEVHQGTDGFSASRLIGEGGFGHVYHASMRNTDFAVKRLKEDSHMGWSVVKESFKTEVEQLSQYRHPNITDLVGYSVGGGAHCLIYIYMPNGSLEDRLHSETSTALSWTQRVNVLVGSAKAIQYLHSCSPALIHGDVKSSNILLGEHLEPKLGDFGLARLCHNPSRTPGKTSSVAQTSTVRGTLAYLPDEYLKDGQLSVEIDIYSFGVVLLEVLTGRRAVDADSKSKHIFLKDLVSEVEDDGMSSSRGRNSRELACSQAAENIWKKHLDPRLVTKDIPDPHGSREISQLACRCLDRRRKKRPPMAEVFKNLQDAHLGLKAYGRSGVVTMSMSHPHLSAPKTLCSDSRSLDSLTLQFSKLGPQEDTYCCPHKHSSLPLPHPIPSAVTQSEAPESQRSEGLWDSRYSSVRAPCESDESQGFSQCFSSPWAAQTSKSHSWSGVCSDNKTTQTSGFPVVTPYPSSCSSEDKIIINPVRKRFVEKMALYEEGRIPTSDLLSSSTASYGVKNFQRREPEESDEFDYNLG